VRGGTAGAVTLEQSSQLEDLVQFIVAPADHHGPAVGQYLDQPFGVQAAERLAHRSTADPDRGRQLLLTQPRSRAFSARQDALANRLVGEISYGSHCTAFCELCAI
jgi:hypothetical protein